MSWKKIEVSEADISNVEENFRKKAKFLVDENSDGATTEILKELGWNARGTTEFGLNGHSDEDVFALAWKEKRLLITKDDDFLDDKKFPEHRNPGVILLPSEPVDSVEFLDALSIAISIFGDFQKAYEKTKIIIHRNNEITIFRRNLDTGRIERQKYKLDKHGNAFELQS